MVGLVYYYIYLNEDEQIISKIDDKNTNNMNESSHGDIRHELSTLNTMNNS